MPHDKRRGKYRTIPMTNQRSKHLLLPILKWLVSGIMLTYALHSIDVEQITQMISQQNPLVLICVILLMILQLAISTLRWQHLVFLLSGRIAKPRYAKLFGLNYISIFFNSCLPGTIGGDVVRAMLLKSEKFSLTLCAHSVIIDRMMAALGVYMMMLLSLPWIGKILPKFPATLFLSLGVATIIIGYVILAIAPAILEKFDYRHLLRMAAHLINSIRQVAFAPYDVCITLLQAIAANSVFCTACYILGVSLGAHLSLFDSLILIPPVILLTLLPISVGGWGVREVSMVGFLSLAGVPKEIALSIAVQMGILAIITSLPGAWCYAKSRRKQN